MTAPNPGAETPGAPTESVARGRKPPQGEPVIDRTFALLSAFTVRRRAMSLSELCQHTGLPKSTALRLARALTKLGVMERTADGSFVIGLRLWEIASLAPQLQDLRTVAMPFMEDLNLITRQHVLLAVRDGDDALLVERLSTHTASPILYRVGGRLPLHSTGVGHVLLAFAAVEDQQDYLGRPWRTEPEDVPVSCYALRQTLAMVRRDGFASVTRAEPRPLVSVAAPIRDGTDTVIAALSVVVPQEDEVRSLTTAVRAAARAVSRGLGARQLGR